MRPAYRLVGPKGRRYVFTPLGQRVRVMKYQGLTVVEDRVCVPAVARGLFRFLRLRAGYRM